MTGLRRAVMAAVVFVVGAGFTTVPASSAKTSQDDRVSPPATHGGALPVATRPPVLPPFVAKSRPATFGTSLGRSQLPRPPSTTDARTGKPLHVATKLGSQPRTTPARRPVQDVQPPPSANCQSIGGSSDDFACYVTPGMTFDLPVSSTIPSENSNYTCSAASPEFYWVSNPPRGVTVTLLNWSGSSSCGSTITGTVRVSFSAQAPWNTTDFPDFTFKLIYTLCTNPPFQSCATGDNGFGPTGGTRYAFATPVPPRTPAIPERACGRCNGTTIGKPIDVSTGEVWNEKTDLALSGPFGLSFTRFYGNQTAGSADLGGTNWLHNYAASLDLTNAGSGNVTSYDSVGMPYYFTGIAANASSYDNFRGSTLALSGDSSTYTLTEFDGRNWTFNAAGQLTALHDRVGNAQTVTRDPTAGNNNRIASVADSAGRQLCFYYDSANRIVAVAGWMSRTPCPAGAPTSTVSTPVVTLAYNTGTNCAVNSLCAVAEPDGNSWTYQYANSDPNYPYNLATVLDPLGDPEETNTFTKNQIIHQESGSCSNGSPCNDTGNYINITYPSSGSTTTVMDGLGRSTSITYDPNTLLLTTISGAMCGCGGDQTRTYTYDAYQRLAAETDNGTGGSVKHTTSYTYRPNVNGRAYPGPTNVTEVVDASITRVTTILYYLIGDARQDLPQTMTQPSVDTPGQVVTTSDAYSLTGLLTSRTMTGYVNGNSTSYTRRWSYDGRGRVVTETGPRTDVTQTTTYAYFADTDSDAARAGQMHTITDALGHVVTLANDNLAGFNSYDPFGDPLSMTDANGVNTEYVFDVRGRPLSSTVLQTTEGEQSLITQTNYDAAGRKTLRILPARNSISFVYDTSDRLIQIMRADASLAKHERLTVAYNTSDQKTSIAAQACLSPSPTCASWSPASWHAGYAYSSITSDLTQVINADNTAQLVTYNPQGAVATLNDENHSTGSDYTYTYDIAGRRLSETRFLPGAPGGSVSTNYTYDLHDNMIGVTDPNNNVTTYRYDDFDRVVKETSPVSGVTTYAYDAEDNVTSMLNANGTTTTFTYDALDRVLTETDSKGQANASEAWTYDDPTVGHFGVGRLATMTDPSGSCAFSYDRLGKVQVENHNVAGTTFTYGYGYDLNGNRSTVTYPDGTIVSYAFDFADRPYSAQQTEPNQQQLSVRRAATLARLRAKGLAAPSHPAKSELSPRITRLVPAIVTLPRGRIVSPPTRPQPLANSRSTTAPAGTRRLVASGSRPDSVLVSSATYAPYGPMTSTTFGNGTTQTLSYDPRYLPQENKLVSNGVLIADHVYTKDHVGNITAISDALDAGYARNFAYDDLNRLTTANSGSKLWGATGNGYTYDAMGNMLTLCLGATRSDTFTYRPGVSGSTGLPLISSVVENGSTRNISYDAVGSELGDGASTFAYGARELLGSALPNFQTYAYDGFRRRVQAQTSTGQQRTSLYDNGNRLLAETAASPPSTSIAYDYVWFGKRPVAQLDANGTHWTFTDHLATPLVQTDASGAVTWQAEHEPYGLVYALRASDSHQPLRFPGQESQQFDTGANGASELNYNGSRWYRPSWGRYSASDTIGLNGGNNLYRYVDDDPLTNTDFDGLVPKAGTSRQFQGFFHPYSPRPKIKCPKWNIETVRRNIDEMSRYGDNPMWFWSKVKPGGQWDFKAHGWDYPGVSNADLDFTGNFNYGATAAAAGWIPENVMLAAGAGGNPEPGGTGNRGFLSIGGTWPFGEKIVDARIEEDGYTYGMWLVSFNIDLCPHKQHRRC